MSKNQGQKSNPASANAESTLKLAESSVPQSEKDTVATGGATGAGLTLAETPKPKGKPGRKSKMSEAEKINMANARKLAAEGKETLLAELMGEQAEKQGVWDKLAEQAPNRLLAIRQRVNAALKTALTTRVAAAEAELARVKKETEAALAEFAAPAAGAEAPASEQAAG